MNFKSIITVAVVVVLSLNKENIQFKNLPIVLFQMLQINELNIDESEELLHQIVCLSKSFESMGLVNFAKPEIYVVEMRKSKNTIPESGQLCAHNFYQLYNF